MSNGALTGAPASRIRRLHHLVGRRRPPDEVAPQLAELRPRLRQDRDAGAVAVSETGQRVGEAVGAAIELGVSHLATLPGDRWAIGEDPGRAAKELGQDR